MPQRNAGASAVARRRRQQQEQEQKQCKAYLLTLFPQACCAGGAHGHVSNKLDAVQGDPPGIDQHRLLHKALHRPQPPQALCAAVQVHVDLRRSSCSA